MRYNLAFAALATTAYAHTWVEQLNVIAPNGTMVGEPGFPRGNVKRGTPGFGDPAMVNLIPPNDRTTNDIRDTDLMCKSTQTKQVQGDGDRLKTSAGSNVALRYQENGHVSLPENQPGKPENRGTLYVYGTTDPQEDDKFTSIHRVWNADGSGGDKRGVLLSTQNYDDGQCYQVNGGQISTTRQKTFSHTANQLMGADLWCQQDIQIPTTAPAGKPYTLYWVWDWPTMPGTEGFPDGKQEIYTTCMDVDIENSGNGSGGTTGTNGAQSKAVAVNFVKGQDFANAAVADQVADIANPTAVVGKFIPFPGAGSAAQSGATSPQAATATSAASGPNVPTGNPQQPNLTNTQTSVAATSGGHGRPHRTGRPDVSQVTATGTPFSQPTGAPTNGGGVGNGNNPQNTGTAISNAAAATTATEVVNGPVSTVTEIATSFSTIMQTEFKTVTAAKRDAEVNVALDAAATPVPQSKTEPAYLLRARNPFNY